MDESIVKSANLDERATAARQSKAEMESLIIDFQTFLHGFVYKYSQFQQEDRREELYSTAAVAFCEAIRGYDAQKGHFFPFANRVIKQRVFDHLRRIYKHEGKTVPLEDGDDGQEAQAQSAAITDASISLYEAHRRKERLADEIEQFKAELSVWGITMADLAKQSPKHRTLREEYRRIVTAVAHMPDILQTIQIKRYLPVQAISKLINFPPKKLERARTFILASLILKTGDYDLLSDYVKDGG